MAGLATDSVLYLTLGLIVFFGGMVHGYAVLTYLH